MKEEIIKLIAEILQVDPERITENTTANELEEWDSLAHVMIIGELQDRLGIQIPLDEAVDIVSVAEIFEKAGL